LSKRIQLRHLTHFHRADPEYGGAVTAGLGIPQIDFEDLALCFGNHRRFYWLRVA
jgi:catalase